MDLDTSCRLQSTGTSCSHDDKYFLPFADADPDSNFIDFKQGPLTCSYFSEDSLKSLCVDKKIANDNCFSLFHLNTRSLPKQFDNLIDHLDMLPIDFSVIGLTETWLNSHKVSMFSISSYNHYPCFRSERCGGGVSLFVKENIKSSLRNDLVALVGDEAEAVFLELVEPFSNKKVIVGCIYRPPNSNINRFIDCFCTTLSKIKKMKDEKKTCYIMGDFNINLLNNQSSQFINDLNASSFFPLITRATRITATNETLFVLQGYLVFCSVIYLTIFLCFILHPQVLKQILLLTRVFSGILIIAI